MYNAVKKRKGNEMTEEMWKAYVAMLRAANSCYIAWLELWSPKWWVDFKAKEQEEINDRLVNGGLPSEKNTRLY